MNSTIARPLPPAPRARATFGLRTERLAPISTSAGHVPAPRLASDGEMINRELAAGSRDGVGTPWQLRAIALFQMVAKVIRPAIKRLMGIVIFVLVVPHFYNAYPLQRTAAIRDGRAGPQSQSPPLGTPALQQSLLRSQLLARSLPQGWGRDETPTVSPVIEKRFGKAVIETYYCPVTVCGTSSRVVVASFAAPTSGTPATAVGELVKDIVADLDIADSNAAKAETLRRQQDSTRAPVSILMPGHAPYANHLWGAAISKQSHGPSAGQTKQGYLVILQVRDTWDGWEQRAQAHLVKFIPAER